MSKTLTPSAASPVIVRDAKGRKFLEVVEAAYNKAFLTEDEAQRVNQAGGLAELISGFIAERRDTLLCRVAQATVSGAKKFAAKDQLKEANVGYIWDDFKNFFLEKTEENVPDATINVHRLKKNSLDKPIMEQLGEGTEIQLVHLFALLKAQSQGQEGPLLVDGYANIAYIKDKNGKLWAVHAPWYSDCRCWDLDADSVDGPAGWRAGNRILSRDLS